MANCKISHSEFNSLPDFCMALQSTDHSTENLLKLGSEICRTGLERTLGIALLHRHYFLVPGEILKRQRVSKSLATYPLGKMSRHNLPVSWKVDSSGHRLIAIEFAEPSEIDESEYPSADQIWKIAKEIRRHHLAETYGLVFAPLFGRDQSENFELTDDNLRVSLVSSVFKEKSAHDDFRQSVFFFKRAGKRIEIDNATGCSNCVNCAPSGISSEWSPVAEQFIVYDDCFGLGISTRVGAAITEDQIPNLVTSVENRMQNSRGE